MLGKPRILLIGGASHVGKSTLAQSLAAHLGWQYRATDRLARHPGRPWPTESQPVPHHVAEHYRLLSADELIADVLHHYRETVWPLIEAIVTVHTAVASDQLVLEGSALLPELVESLNFDNIAAIWLTTSNEFLSRRIYAASDYKSKSDREKIIIDRFLQRNNLFNDRTLNTVNQLGLTNVNVENANVDALIGLCLSAIKQNSQLN